MTVTSASSAEIKEVTLSPRVVVGLRERVSVGELAGFFARTMPVAAAELARARITPAGPPLAVYRQELGDTSPEDGYLDKDAWPMSRRLPIAAAAVSSSAETSAMAR